MQGENKKEKVFFHPLCHSACSSKLNSPCERLLGNYFKASLHPKFKLPRQKLDFHSREQHSKKIEEMPSWIFILGNNTARKWRKCHTAFLCSVPAWCNNKLVQLSSADTDYTRLDTVIVSDREVLAR